ncbi:MAG TPA: hypothetical protein VEQ17_05910 [Steroidobacteraceae bacterium]|nr:hypothetical protein [Steroidobacteraceae bacterium]
MGRKDITPGLFRHPALLDVSIAARYLYLGLLALRDANGAVHLTPKGIRAEILPADDVDITRLLGELVQAHLLQVMDDPLAYLPLQLATARAKVVKPVPPADAGTTTAQNAATVWEHYKATMNRPRAAMDAKRGAMIRKALLTYSVEDLRNSITGYTYSAWHMGANDNNKAYNSIELMLRDAQKIDQGLEFYETMRPGKPPSPGVNGATKLQGTSAEDRWDSTAVAAGAPRAVGLRGAGGGEAKGPADPRHLAAGADARQQPASGTIGSDGVPRARAGR